MANKALFTNLQVHQGYRSACLITYVYGSYPLHQKVMQVPLEISYPVYRNEMCNETLNRKLQQLVIRSLHFHPQSIQQEL